jgi:succinoglycan biosynthesis transport protein ExoP
MISEWEDQDSGPSSFLAHIPAIVEQRKLFLVIPTIVLFLAGAIAAFLLPTSYRSSSILLVESAQMQIGTAEEKSNEAIDQRVAKVRQQVLSRPDLIEMIQRLDLYANERASKPLSEIIEKLRDSVTFQPVGAEFSGGGKSSTIAFSVSVDYPDPVKAQAVAQDIVDRILRIDSAKNAEQAQDTVQFLTDQASSLEAQASLLEVQISGIKARNGPAISNSSIGMFGGNGGNYDGQIAALMRENSQLNSQRDLTKTAANRDPVVAAAEQQLAAARAVYAESHPDVVLARQRLAESKELAAKNVGNIPMDPITSQLEFNNSQIAALRAAKARDSAQTSAILNAQARGPVVMDQIAQLQQKLDGLNSQYQQVANKLMQAQATAKMKNEQKGERLTVIDPPVVPDKPDWPNRPLFVGGGALAGLGLGIILMFGIELVLRPIRGIDTVKAITGSAPLAAVPTIVARRTMREPWYRKLWPFKQRNNIALEN